MGRDSFGTRGAEGDLDKDGGGVGNVLYREASSGNVRVLSVFGFTKAE